MCPYHPANLTPTPSAPMDTSEAMWSSPECPYQPPSCILHWSSVAMFLLCVDPWAQAHHCTRSEEMGDDEVYLQDTRHHSTIPFPAFMVTGTYPETRKGVHPSCSWWCTS
ncbi:hypothetical protein IAQ61_009435 [Plenodomus lingam]|uniref:uncharacterized protein n=1 Tax=Leptosphaeria maculans TaxID=5022 RepID=UPI0033343BDA|nr:hypothetical protein IAQ61_009435 [Plenodomus lingam]